MWVQTNTFTSSVLGVPVGQAKLVVTNTKSTELPCCAWQRRWPDLGSLVEVTTGSVHGKNEGWGSQEDLAPPQPLSWHPCIQPNPSIKTRTWDFSLFDICRSLVFKARGLCILPVHS